MPLTTVRWGTVGEHVAYVWKTLPGDIAHPDGYVLVSYGPTAPQFVIPTDMIVPEV